MGAHSLGGGQQFAMQYEESEKGTTHDPLEETRVEEDGLRRLWDPEPAVLLFETLGMGL